MALSQSCLLHCSAPYVGILSASASVNRHPTTVQVASKARSVPICRASSENRSADAFQKEDVGQAPMIFKDESNGILCYYNEHGELTCEGWDEGPHFQPDPQQPGLRRRRKFTPRAMQGRGAGETVNFKNIAGRMDESLREVANESLECSEL